jgi:hypothetical protein
MAPPPSGGIAGGHNWKLEWDDHGTPKEHMAGCYTSGCHTSSSMASFDYKNCQTEIRTLADGVRSRLQSAGLLDANDAVLTTRWYKRNELQAIWNYKLVRMDRSDGVHNTAYSRSLLNAALDLVPAPPAKPAEAAAR